MDGISPQVSISDDSLLVVPPVFELLACACHSGEGGKDSPILAVLNVGLLQNWKSSVPGSAWRKESSELFL